MKTITKLQKPSKEFSLFCKMWSKTWEKLFYKNPYYNLLSNIDTDNNDFSMILEEKCCLKYEDLGGNSKTTDDTLFVDNIITDYNQKYHELLMYAYENFCNYINSYLKNHNIQIILTGRGNWTTMRFMNNFLGDFNNKKVVFWQTIYDDESGEFFQFDKSFVDNCVNLRKIPDPPKINIPLEWKNLAKSLEI